MKPPRSPQVQASVGLAILALGISAGLAGSPENQQLFMNFNHAASRVSPLVWSALTILGDTYVAVVLLVPCLWWRPQVLFNFLLALPLAGGATSLVKNLIDSPRPAGLLEAGSFQTIGPVLQFHAYPSGHTLTAFAVLGLLLLTARPAPKWLWWGGLSLGWGVALSRMAVGAHWPADVLAGAALGWLCAELAVSLGSRLVQRYPLLSRPRSTSMMAWLWLAMSLLLLLKIDTAYPLANPLQQILALAATITCLVFLWESRKKSSSPER